MSSHSQIKIISTAAVGLLALSALAGCAPEQAANDSAEPTSDDSTTLVVWTDTTRQPGFVAYQEQHPDVKMDIQTFDEASLLAKIQLFNRTGEGWPDVLFSGDPNNVTNLSAKPYEYAYPLDKIIPTDIQDGFGAANDGCMVDGKLYCLKNDLAQTVLWYNAPLMAKFGYSLPTTWDEYEALGEDVAANHPGYILGAAGDSLAWNNYYWGSGCPLSEVTATDQVTIDAGDKRCTRVTEMLDTMRANGSVASVGDFDPALIDLAKADKILMLPGGAWYGEYLFKPAESLAYPDGVITTGAYPKWADEPENWSGAAGGGIYLVSAHSENQVGAADVIQWMTTDPEWTSKSQTFPAYGPAADAWGQRLADDPFYSSDPFPALKDASNKINPSVSPVRYTVFAAFDEVVTPKLAEGQTYAELLPALADRLTELAKSVGYSVKG